MQKYRNWVAKTGATHTGCPRGYFFKEHFMIASAREIRVSLGPRTRRAAATLSYYPRVWCLTCQKGKDVPLLILYFAQGNRPTMRYFRPESNHKQNPETKQITPRHLNADWLTDR